MYCQGRKNRLKNLIWSQLSSGHLVFLNTFRAKGISLKVRRAFVGTDKRPSSSMWGRQDVEGGRAAKALWAGPSPLMAFRVRQSREGNWAWVGCMQQGQEWMAPGEAGRGGEASWAFPDMRQPRLAKVWVVPEMGRVITELSQIYCKERRRSLWQRDHGG